VVVPPFVLSSCSGNRCCASQLAMVLPDLYSAAAYFTCCCASAGCDGTSCRNQQLFIVPTAVPSSCLLHWGCHCAGGAKPMVFPHDARARSGVRVLERIIFIQGTGECASRTYRYFRNIFVPLPPIGRFRSNILARNLFFKVHGMNNPSRPTPNAGPIPPRWTPACAGRACGRSRPDRVPDPQVQGVDQSMQFCAEI
jgi:hypothetical protein